MNDLSQPMTIVVEEEFPHPPALVWRAISDGALIAQWMMPPEGYAPVVGCAFSFKTKPAGAWDGTIRCKVLRVEEQRVLSYAWAGGDAGNIGYGSLLSTTVTMTLTPTATGTRLRVEHAGFVLPQNEVAWQNLGGGWKTVMGRISALLPQVAEGGQ